jgi:hypothetical protein
MKIIDKDILNESEERTHGKLLSELKPSLKTVMIFRARDSKGDELTLGIGESGYINGLNINFETLLQDSRCPNDVTCVWAGAVEVMVKLVDAKNVSKSEEVKMTSIEAPHIFENYEVSISSVVPVKNSKIEIKPKDYLITFKVSKKN